MQTLEGTRREHAEAELHVAQTNTAAAIQCCRSITEYIDCVSQMAASFYMTLPLCRVR
jgi:hypothetical protein